MAKVIDHKTQAVTLGVLDQTLDVHPELQQVTFTDHNGTAHTVHAHTGGPFGSPEDIVRAWEDGVLHPYESHEVAAEYEERRGNRKQATTLFQLAGHSLEDIERRRGGGF